MEDFSFLCFLLRDILISSIKIIHSVFFNLIIFSILNSDKMVCTPIVYLIIVFVCICKQFVTSIKYLLFVLVTIIVVDYKNIEI